MLYSHHIKNAGTIMPIFEAKTVKYLETPRGVAFSGLIVEGKTVLGKFHNLGNGGHTVIDGLNSVDIGGDWQKWVDATFSDEYEPEAAAVEHLLDVHDGVIRYDT
jgi:hypothetical protein